MSDDEEVRIRYEGSSFEGGETPPLERLPNRGWEVGDELLPDRPGYFVREVDHEDDELTFIVGAGYGRAFLAVFQLSNGEEAIARDHDFAGLFARALEEEGARYAAAQTTALLKQARASHVIELHDSELSAVGRAARTVRDESDELQDWHRLTELQET